MILYHHAGACSLADHIALIEAGLPYKLVSINRDKRTEDGRDFLAINPKGYVPALELDDGTVLTENDQPPSSGPSKMLVQHCSWRRR